LVDRPIAYYLLEEAYRAGIRHVVFVTHKDNPRTKAFFQSKDSAPLLAPFPDLAVSFVETNERKGDGQAIMEAERIVGSRMFAVSMGDMITLPGESILAELVADFESNGEAIISVEEVPLEKTGQYGVIDPSASEGSHYCVRGIVEKPRPEEAPSTMAMTGKYVLLPEIFGYLHTLSGGDSELKLAHALNAYAKDRPLNALAARTRYYDTGTKIDLLRTEVAFSLAHPELGRDARTLLSEWKDK
jgi:UTP--glucose-1-phosphate uridylyltransferase